MELSTFISFGYDDIGVVSDTAEHANFLEKKCPIYNRFSESLKVCILVLLK